MDAIVEIPQNRLRYFGGPGRMLLPSPTTIAALINRIPECKLLTTSLLREVLTAQFDVEGTCPITTKIALQKVANEGHVPYWRVIGRNGQLFAKFPDHAALLKQEGFTIDANKVVRFKENLVHFS